VKTKDFEIEALTPEDAIKMINEVVSRLERIAKAASAPLKNKKPTVRT
jgi:hypothetical protein